MNQKVLYTCVTLATLHLLKSRKQGVNNNTKNHPMTVTKSDKTMPYLRATPQQTDSNYFTSFSWRGATNLIVLEEDLFSSVFSITA